MLQLERRPTAWLGVALITGALLTLAPSCSIKKLAANKVGDAIASGGSTYESDDDLELVGDAMPFSLKLIESLLSATPDHIGLLNAACKGFTSYGYVFVQNGDKALSDPDLATEDAIKARARRLYQRALRYGLRGLDVTYVDLSSKLMADPKAAMAPVKKTDVERVYWTAASLGLAISISKGDAAMIARVPEVQAMLDRAMELDETWGAGSLHEFAITLASTKPGGADAATMKKHYERALELSGGNRASLFTTYAEATAIPKQDVAAFRALIARAIAVDTNAQPDWRVANLAAQKRARWLEAHAADFFLLPDDDASSTGGSR